MKINPLSSAVFCKMSGLLCVLRIDELNRENDIHFSSFTRLQTLIYHPIPSPPSSPSSFSFYYFFFPLHLIRLFFLSISSHFLIASIPFFFLRVYFIFSLLPPLPSCSYWSIYSSQSILFLLHRLPIALPTHIS